MKGQALVWIILAILVLAGLGFWWYSQNPEVFNDLRNGAAMEEATTTPGTNAESGTGEGDVNIDISVGEAPMTASVAYSESGFTPGEVRVKVGGTVTWVDQETGDMWVASDVHPTHSEYAGTSLREHCDDATDVSFDQCERGGTYSFTFDKVGTWEYHNHADSSHTGRVIVVE